MSEYQVPPQAVTFSWSAYQMTQYSRKRRGVLIAALMLALPSTVRAQNVAGEEPVIGLPCEGCEGVFEGLPRSLESVGRLAPPEEPGEPMRIEGTVYDEDDRPVPGVIVYAYQTNAQGIYPPGEGSEGWTRRHGSLRGWVITDAEGRYRFDTVRPASYPNRTMPAHVHMHVIEIGCCTYYIDDIQFEDDPLLTDEERAQSSRARGGSGLTRPVRNREGVWAVTRDIRLGAEIPGYEDVRRGQGTRRTR